MAGNCPPVSIFYYMTIYFLAGTQLTEAQWAGQFKKDSEKLVPKINDLIASGRLGPSETDRYGLRATLHGLK